MFRCEVFLGFNHANSQAHFGTETLGSGAETLSCETKFLGCGTVILGCTVTLTLLLGEVELDGKDTKSWESEHLEVELLPRITCT